MHVYAYIYGTNVERDGRNALQSHFTSFQLLKFSQQPNIKLSTKTKPDPKIKISTSTKSKGRKKIETQLTN